MKQTFYIYEDDEGQSLRAEIGEEKIVLISRQLDHERPVRVGESGFRDRYLASIDIHVWLAIGYIAGE